MTTTKSVTPLSVIIPVHNEEDNIAACLDTVCDWAAEIIVVESFGNDRTLDILADYGRQFPDKLKVFRREYKSPADQKNWAIEQATQAWALFLDADERITPDLRLEITTLLNDLKSIDYDCFHVARLNHFNGKRIYYSGWQNDAPIRLVDVRRCRYRDTQVHEEIETAGLRVGRLRAKMLHFTFKNLEHFVAKQRRYAEWSAIDHDHRTGRITLWHLWVKPAFRFFKHYILKLGILDAQEGYTIARIMAAAVRWRYEHLRQMRKI